MFLLPLLSRKSGESGARYSQWRRSFECIVRFTRRIFISSRQALFEDHEVVLFFAMKTLPIPESYTSNSPKLSRCYTVFLYTFAFFPSSLSQPPNSNSSSKCSKAAVNSTSNSSPRTSPATRTGINRLTTRVSPPFHNPLPHSFFPLPSLDFLHFIVPLPIASLFARISETER